VAGRCSRSRTPRGRSVSSREVLTTAHPTGYLGARRVFFGSQPIVALAIITVLLLAPLTKRLGRDLHLSASLGQGLPAPPDETNGLNMKFGWIWILMGRGHVFLRLTVPTLSVSTGPGQVRHEGRR
jgi:hypothetical protein